MNDTPERPHQPSTPGDSQASGRGSLTFSASKRFVRPMQREITALINAYHQAESECDEEARLALRQSILNRLDDFDAANADGHEYPDWIRPVLRANAHGAFGELDQALRFEHEGERHAQLDMHKAISANNLSDHYRRLGNFPQAIDHAEFAHKLWSDNEGMIVNLALALFQADRKRDAGKIIAKLGELASLEDPHDILAAHLRFEDEMCEMAELDEVQDLYQRIRTIHNPNESDR